EIWQSRLIAASSGGALAGCYPSQLAFWQCCPLRLSNPRQKRLTHFNLSTNFSMQRSLRRRRKPFAHTSKRTNRLPKHIFFSATLYFASSARKNRSQNIPKELSTSVHTPRI